MLKSFLTKSLVLIMFCLLTPAASYAEPDAQPAFTCSKIEASAKSACEKVYDRTLNSAGKGWKKIRRNGHMYFAYPMPTPEGNLSNVLMLLVDGTQYMDDDGDGTTDMLVIKKTGGEADFQLPTEADQTAFEQAIKTIAAEL